MNGDFYKQKTLGGSPQSPAAPSVLPETIGPYRVESLLDKGGSSLLYLGIHPDTHEPLTIKVLSHQNLTRPDMIDRFCQEARIIGLTSHPNIIKLYGEGKWEGGLYIAMEFVQGISLRQLILQDSLSLKRSLDIVLQIAYALAHLHAHGVIHRDLKPENILLTAHGGIKVIDFGISLIMPEAGAQIQSAGLVGTPVYMSPEQKENPLSVTYSSDIYSLGIIAYELVLGKLSHGSVHISLMPKGLQKILAKALQPRPADRYLDIVDFITDLTHYVESQEFDKDLRGKDFISDISEEIRKAPELFLPRSLPNWPKVEMGLARTTTEALFPLYYDFFDLKEGRMGLLMAEPSEKGVKGVIAAAILHGMITTLTEEISRPNQLAGRLNNLLINHPMDQFCTLSSLVLDPLKNQLHYISCGYGPLWDIPNVSQEPKLIEANNSALGLNAQNEFIEVTANWHVGDILLLHTFISQELDFEKQIKETQYLPPQKMVEALGRKLTNQSEDRANTFIALTRTS